MTQPPTTVKKLILPLVATLACACQPRPADDRPVVGVSLLILANEFIVTLETTLVREAERQGVRLNGRLAGRGRIARTM